MKTVILALLVLLVVSQGEALRCYCGGRTHCSGRVQTCSGSNQVCARITFVFDNSYFQSCYNARACRRVINTRGISGRCCSSDLCN
ncbi:CD59 glycoprotein-like [Epinephelus moara]|uniref:CD59 glycoprotein-like n=1 Tax=Epinephelus moara TaxID=300413 RepID=UPI00214E33AE|nr:CD59 glycoprotein-like [Epinephelus moara]